MTELAGRSALVTGAAQGIGRAVAELLADRGASVLAVDVSDDVAALRSGAVEPRVVDLADPSQLAALTSELATESEIDVLVNCAAGYPPGDLLGTTDDDWLRVFRVNVLAAGALCRAMAGRLARQHRPGAIVNVGSVQQALPLPGYSAYVSSKGALAALTSALAVELGPHRIRVNEVTLGLVNSPALQAKVGDDFFGRSPVPTLLGRTGTPREAAEAIAFLVSDRASYITGAVLAVDGGRRLSRRSDPQADRPVDPAPGPRQDAAKRTPPPSDGVAWQPQPRADSAKRGPRSSGGPDRHITPRIAGIETFCVAPRWMLVRVTTDTGEAGWGEAIVPKRRAAVLGALDDLTRNLVGTPAGRIEEAWHRMRRGAFFRGGPVLATAAAAVEHALWDLKARRLGVPVHDLLGGPVRDSVRVYAWIGGDRPHDVVADAKRRLEQGFTAVKLNASEELDHIARADDIDAVVARVDALRTGYGSGLDIALDFHGRVHRAMARPLLTELAQYRLLWVEEPLSPGHEDLLPELARAAAGTRIATGERLTSRWEFRRLLQAGGVDILQPDVSLTGLGELAKICHLAEAYDVPVVPHCPNGPVSLAASLQVASCSLNVPMHEQSLGMHYHSGYDGLPAAEMFDYLTDPAPLRPAAGDLRVPAGPGLGVDLDEPAVRAAHADWALPDPDWRHPDGRIAEW